MDQINSIADIRAVIIEARAALVEAMINGCQGSAPLVGGCWHEEPVHRARITLGKWLLRVL